MPDVDRGYAIFVTLQFIVSGLGLFLLPVFSSKLGTTGMFLSLAGLNLVGLVLTRYMPGPAMDKGHRPIARSELHVLLAWATVIGALGFLVFEAANTAHEHTPENRFEKNPYHRSGTWHGKKTEAVTSRCKTSKKKCTMVW